MKNKMQKSKFQLYLEKCGIKTHALGPNYRDPFNKGCLAFDMIENFKSKHCWSQLSEEDRQEFSEILKTQRALLFDDKLPTIYYTTIQYVGSGFWHNLKRFFLSIFIQIKKLS